MIAKNTWTKLLVAAVVLIILYALVKNNAKRKSVLSTTEPKPEKYEVYEAEEETYDDDDEETYDDDDEEYSSSDDEGYSSSDGEYDDEQYAPIDAPTTLLE